MVRRFNSFLLDLVDHVMQFDQRWMSHLLAATIFVKLNCFPMCVYYLFSIQSNGF